MAREVRRYPVPIDGQVHEFELQGQILHAGFKECFEDPPTMSVWALWDSTLSPARKAFVVVGTGHPLPEGFARYVGTGMLMQGRLVFHMFECSPSAAQGEPRG